MSRIETLRKNYQRICGMPWDRNLAGAAAGLGRRLRQGGRAEAPAADRLVRGGDPGDRAPLAPVRPDRRLRRLASAGPTTSASPSATSSRRNSSTTAPSASSRRRSPTG